MNLSDDPSSGGLAEPDVVQQVVDRLVADRVEAATGEVQRLVNATFTVIEQAGSTDLSLRAILAAAGWSNQAFYRYFASKDHLLLTLLLSGLRRLAVDLQQRTSQADQPAEQVDAWVRCVLEQAAHPRIAAQTRPFIAGLGRLEARFPDDLRQSRELLISTLYQVLPGEGRDADAAATYDLAFGAMQRHLMARTVPAADETASLVRYAQRALGTGH